MFDEVIEVWSKCYIGVTADCSLKTETTRKSCSTYTWRLVTLGFLEHQANAILGSQQIAHTRLKLLGNHVPCKKTDHHRFKESTQHSHGIKRGSMSAEGFSVSECHMKTILFFPYPKDSPSMLVHHLQTC